MKKIKPDSKIEIWSNEYINDVERRQEKDRKLSIVQLEHGNIEKEYMVEVIEENKREYIDWIPVEQNLPLAPAFDWVLVRIVFKEGGMGVPHIAELRDDGTGNLKWYDGDGATDLEERYGVRVTHWKPITDETVE